MAVHPQPQEWQDWKPPVQPLQDTEVLLSQGKGKRPKKAQLPDQGKYLPCQPTFKVRQGSPARRPERRQEDRDMEPGRPAIHQGSRLDGKL